MEDEGEYVPGIASVIGELEGMCGSAEIAMRADTRQVDKFEIAPGFSIQNLQIDPSKCVKKYQRSSADKKYLPSEIRTVAACWESVVYLLGEILDFDVNPKPNFSGACYESSYFDIYSFLRDRLRAVRVDLHVQNCVTDPVFVRVHEICLRFELLSLYLLWGRDFGVGDDRKFDLHMSLTALSQTIDPLTNGYVRRRESSLVSAEQLNTEAEITRYILLLSLTSRGGSKQFKAHFLKQPKDLQTHIRVVEAFDFCLAFYSERWAFLLHKFETLDFLSACAVLPVLNLVRARLLWRVVRTNRPFFMRRDGAGPMPAPRPERIPLSEMQATLAMKSSFECGEFLKFFGVDHDAHSCQLPPRQLSRDPIRWWMSTAEWRDRTGDVRIEIPEFSWPLEEAFSKRLGQDAGDLHAPDRCEFPRRIEAGLVEKFVELSKRMSRGEIVAPGVTEAKVKARKLTAQPTFSNEGAPSFNLTNGLAPSRASHPFGADPANFSKPERPFVSLEPLSARIEKKLVTPSSETPLRPVAVQNPILSSALLDQLKRPRESPPFPVQRISDPTPPSPKRREPPPIFLPEPLPTIPALPDIASDFDMLASQLGSLDISKPAMMVENFPKSPRTKSPIQSSTARIVQAEIDQSVQYMEEVRIGDLRSRFVGLKCLRRWQTLSGERRKWLVVNPTRLH